MQHFSRLQKVTVLTSAFGIGLLAVSLSTQNLELSYLAGFIMRLAGFLFMCANEKVRFLYFIPVAIALVNVFNSLESLLFLELLASSLIFHLNIVMFFSKR